MRDSQRSVRFVSVGAFVAWLLLMAATYGHLPDLSAPWSFTLLGSLPSWLGWLLAGMALLVTTEEARRGLVHVARRTAGWLAGLSRSQQEGLLFAFAVLGLWVLRERQPYGPTTPLLWLLGSEDAAAQVRVGSTLALRGMLRGAENLGLPVGPTIKLASSLLGAATLVLLVRASRAAAGQPGRAIIPLVVVSGGLLRALVGRIDLRFATVAAACACLLLALRAIRRDSGVRPAALGFGIAACLHPLCFFLLPVAPLLPWLSDRADSASGRARLAASCTAWALAPALLYAVVAWTLYSPSGPGAGVVWRSMLGAPGWILGITPVAGRNPSHVLLSAAHLKSLAASLFLLAPAAVPVVLAFALASPRRFRDPVGVFLSVSTALLVVGAMLNRPVWFYWDQFAIPGLFLAFLAGHLIAGIHDRVLRGQLAAAVVGFQLLFVGMPLFGVHSPWRVSDGGADAAPALTSLSRPALPGLALPPGPAAPASVAKRIAATADPASE